MVRQTINVKIGELLCSRQSQVKPVSTPLRALDLQNGRRSLGEFNFVSLVLKDFMLL
jgi:hypothetical protein